VRIVPILSLPPRGAPDCPPEIVGRWQPYRPRQPSQARRRRPLPFRASRLCPPDLVERLGGFLSLGAGLFGGYPMLGGVGLGLIGACGLSGRLGLCRIDPLPQGIGPLGPTAVVVYRGWSPMVWRLDLNRYSLNEQPIRQHQGLAAGERKRM
jgi:hypothetical protein